VTSELAEMVGGICPVLKIRETEAHRKIVCARRANKHVGREEGGGGLLSPKRSRRGGFSGDPEEGGGRGGAWTLPHPTRAHTSKLALTERGGKLWIETEKRRG